MPDADVGRVNVNMNWSGLLLVGLALMFTWLKLTHVINWSWWAVLAPIWAPIAFVFGVIAIFFVVVLIGVILRDRKYQVRGQSNVSRLLREYAGRLKK